MGSDYGFFGETSLGLWNSGATRASRAFEKGNTSDALREASNVVNSYVNHRLGTDRWQKITTAITLVSIAIAVIAGIATSEWIVAIVLGVIGLAISGFLTAKIVDKRIALDNEFYNTYERLKDMIEELSRSN